MTQTMTIQLYDLTSRYRAKKLRDALMRDDDLHRLSRQLCKREPHHVVVSGQPGSGISRLVEAFAFRTIRAADSTLPQKIYLLKTDPLVTLLIDGQPIGQCVSALEQAASKLGKAIIIIEDVHLLLGDNRERDEIVQRLLTPLLTQPNLRLIVTTSPEVFTRSIQANSFLNRYFNHLSLNSLPDEAILKILKTRVNEYRSDTQAINVDSATLGEIIRLSGQYSNRRAQPDAALRLLDDGLADCILHRRGKLKSSDISSLLSEREGIPIGRASKNDTAVLLSLESDLNKTIVGQTQVIKSIAETIQRSRLGFRASKRPQASFLLLGPSGVGKTETAKRLAELLFANQGSFIRLDMTEFSEAHTSIRLIGSPPGYVGYEEGGQLTSPVAREPYSLILLDEIEKAHTKVFDLFLQILDDGRLTDSSGRTINFQDTIIVATSNSANHEINRATDQGIDVNNPDFFASSLLPVLNSQFRLEFLNRFDAILAFRPLGLQHLVSIAQVELQELQYHLRDRKITFDISSDCLARLIRPVYNPVFGARPVRRIIAERFESPLIRHLLTHPETSNLTITGEETWLM